MELLPRTITPIARLSLERRWHSGYLRPAPIFVFALALWNGRDPILKERLFGSTSNEGNHGGRQGYYFYLDNTPTHSYAEVSL